MIATLHNSNFVKHWKTHLCQIVEGRIIELRQTRWVGCVSVWNNDYHTLAGAGEQDTICIELIPLVLAF